MKRSSYTTLSIRERNWPWFHPVLKTLLIVLLTSLAILIQVRSVSAQNDVKQFPFNFNQKDHVLKFEKNGSEVFPYSFSIQCEACGVRLAEADTKFQMGKLDYEEFMKKMTEVVKVYSPDSFTSSAKGANNEVVDLLKSNLEDICNEKFFEVYDSEKRKEVIQELEIQQDTAGVFLIKGVPIGLERLGNPGDEEAKESEWLHLFAYLELAIDEYHQFEKDVEPFVNQFPEDIAWEEFWDFRSFLKSASPETRLAYIQFSKMVEDFSFRVQYNLGKLRVNKADTTLKKIPEEVFGLVKDGSTTYTGSLREVLANRLKEERGALELLLKKKTDLAKMKWSYPSEMEVLFAKYPNPELQLSYVDLWIDKGQILRVKAVGKYKGGMNMITFRNNKPLPFRTEEDLKKFLNHRLVYEESFSQNGKDVKTYLGIKVSDFLDYEPSEKMADNISPGDQKLRIEQANFGKSFPLMQKRVDQYFKVKVFSDVVGYGDQQPNGIIQTEGAVRFDLNNRICQRKLPEVKLKKLGKNGKCWFYLGKDLEFHLGVNKIEGNERFLHIRRAEVDTQSVYYSVFDEDLGRTVLHNDSIALDSSHLGSPYAHTLDLLRYADLNLGTRFNLFSLHVPQLHLQLRANLTGDLFLTAVKDSNTYVTTSDSVFTNNSGNLDTTLTVLSNVRYSSYSVASLAYGFGINARFDPTEAIGVNVGASVMSLKMFSPEPDLQQSYGSMRGNLQNDLDRKLVKSELNRLETMAKDFSSSAALEDQIRIEEAIKRERALLRSNIILNISGELHFFILGEAREKGNEFFLRGQVFKNFGGDNAYFQLQIGYAVDVFNFGSERLKKIQE